jgi:hypothetical protein
MNKLQNRIAVWCLIAGSTVHAQDFKWQVKVDSIRESGFHNIVLAPVVSGQLTPGYPDLRLFDSKNNEIPYLVRQEVAATDVLQIGSLQYTEVPVSATAQTDSLEDKKTYFRIALDAFHYIDRLELELKGPPHYLRTAGIYERLVDSADWENPVSWEYIQPLKLASGHAVITDLPGFRSRELYVIIDNEDNAPLRVGAVKLSQLRRYITADLRQGESYMLRFGDVKLDQPVYDLRYFEDSIPAVIPEVGTGALSELDVPVAPVEPAPSMWSSKVILWSVLGIVVILLTLLSVKMVRDMNKEK